MKIFIVLIILLLSSSHILIYADGYHSSPEYWENPRIYQAKFEERYDKRIIVQRIKLEKVKNENRNYSKNKAYWFFIKIPNTMIPGPWDTPIKIYNEKNYLTQITFIDHHAQYDVRRFWINEKLLYLRVWWGRILATDLIWDAETEEFMYKEMSIWGQGSFQQFQQMKYLRKKKQSNAQIKSE